MGWFLCLEPSWPYVSNSVTVGYWGPHKPGCFTNWRAPEIELVKFTELLYNLRNLQTNDKQNVYWTLYLASKPTFWKQWNKSPLSPGNHGLGSSSDLSETHPIKQHQQNSNLRGPKRYNLWWFLFQKFITKMLTSLDSCCHSLACMYLPGCLWNVGKA